MVMATLGVQARHRVLTLLAQGQMTWLRNWVTMIEKEACVCVVAKVTGK
jgi:hypothetical protein